ncbi:PDZ domain-containing protein, partial [Patescibacteria group bacterium]|nr:PDZ domain-containing protein [Patescibacteria group bacterium]
NEHYQEIYDLYEANQLPKTETFRPNDQVKTEDLYELLLNYGQIKKNEETYTKTAQDLGLTKKSSHPDYSLTKEQILEKTFSTIGVGVNQFFNRDSFPFKDLSENSSTAATAKAAYDLDILESSPQYFKKASRPTRADLAYYLYQIKNNANTQHITIQLDSNPNFTSRQNKLMESQKFLILMDVWETLKTDHFQKDELTDDELLLGAIEGLSAEIGDTYTTFSRPSDSNMILDSISSQYEGIGVLVEMIDNNLTIISPFKNSPAEKAGLKPNDIIIEIDDKDISSLPYLERIQLIKGPAGTKVKIKVLRGNIKKNISVTRESIENKSVYLEFHNDIAYIEFNNFTDNAYSEFKKIAQEIVDKQAKGIILDLTNNPGGYLQTAIDIFGLFTNKKLITTQLKNSNGSTEDYKSNGNGLLKDYKEKVVVIINEGSASASEILTAALRDHNISKKIIGETSFGKGRVQKIVNYIDGSLLKYTSAAWLTPNGKDINKKGIKPDRIVTENYLEEALKEF